MNQDIEMKQPKKFPVGAAVLFAVVSLLSGVYTTLALEEELGSDPEILAVAGTVGVVSSLLFAFIGAGLKYVFTKFPIQWISKETEVYKYDIWSAIFYTNTITVGLNLLVQQFGFQGNFIFNILISALTAGLFLFFYFSGEEKSKPVKKAAIIVQIVFLVLNIILSVAALSFVNSVGV